MNKIKRRWEREAGQAVPLLAAVVAVGALAVVALGHLGDRAVDGARARTAADAAALGGAASGRATASALASANGAELVGYEQMDGGVTVTVRVGVATATARAALLDEAASPTAVRTRSR